MLPNRFTDDASEPEYNTADATLWYFHAVYAWVQAAGALTPRCSAVRRAGRDHRLHERGTRYNIVPTHADGLLFAGEPGTQLTGWTSSRWLGRHAAHRQAGRNNALW